MVTESGFLEGTPTALAQDALLFDGSGGIGIDKDEVGVIANTYLSASGEAEALGGMLAHQFDNSAQGQHALTAEFEHGQQAVLDAWHAAGRPQGSSLLVAQEVGGVVGGDAEDASVSQSSAQGFAVLNGLDGWIALDACTQSLIILVAEP